MTGPPRDSHSSDLRFLLDVKGVDDATQDRLAEAGFNTLHRFALLEDSRENLRRVLGADYNLDPAAYCGNCL